MLRSVRRWGVLLASDVTAILVARLLLRAVRDQAAFGAALSGSVNQILPRGTFPVAQLLASMLFGLLVFGCYSQGERRRDTGAIAYAAIVGVTMVYWNRLWHEPASASVVGFILAAVGFSAILTLERLILNAFVDRAREHDAFRMRMLLIGPARATRSVVERHALGHERGIKIVGFIDTDPHPSPEALGGLSELILAIDRHSVETVVLCGELPEELFSTVVDVADAAGCQIFTLPRAYHLYGFVPQLVYRREAVLLELSRPSIRGGHIIVKRIIDLAAAAIGLVLLSPLLGIIGLLVRLTSPGPIFFRQARVGLRGETFHILKFRSMVADAEALKSDLRGQSVYSDARLFKMPNDPRVTRLGAFLRRSSLDELPQLWNVLMGNMSLVGPRPPIPSEVALYEEHHYARFDVRPGITGPWQVNGRNNITDFEEVIFLEQSYIRNWNIWKDFVILLKTIPVVLRMEGAH